MDNNTLKKYLFLGIILLISVILCWQLAPYFPGILGALTLYILMRPFYFKLTVIKNWKKWVATTFFLLITVVLIVLPIWLIIHFTLPQLYAFVNNSANLDKSLQVMLQHAKNVVPSLSVEELQIKDLVRKAASTLPDIMNATMNMLINTILALFLLYFMLMDGRILERHLQRFLPLKGDNIDNIWEATRIMVVSNAIGIPVVALGQAIGAIACFYIFHVDNPILWGIITGAFSILPVVGTAVVYVPAGIYLFAIGQDGNAIGLLIFAAIVANVDSLLRFTVLKKIGDVHPVITALGVMVGVPLFGIMGLIFGPLLISYLLLLVKIYNVEFSPQTNTPAAIDNATQP